MAKIYETKEDLQRDALTKKVEAAKSNVSTGIWSGVAAIYVGLLQLERPRPQWVEESKLWRRVDKTLPWLSFVAGAAALCVSAFSYKWKKEAEAKLQELGPEQIKLSPQLQAEIISTDTPKILHVSRLQQEAETEKSRAL
jgi:hypothetical protein